MVKKIILIDRWNHYFQNSINQDECVQLEIKSEHYKEPSFEHGLQKLRKMIDGEVIIIVQVLELNLQPDKYDFSKKRHDSKLKFSNTRDFFNQHYRKVVGYDLLTSGRL